MAAEASLDLVEISPQAEPPVCKVMDYGKFKFEEQKKRQAARKKQKQIQVKEIKFRPGTDIGDYNVKLRNLVKFLTEGDKVKVTLRFRGREMAHQELGRDLLKRDCRTVPEDGRPADGDGAGAEKEVTCRRGQTPVAQVVPGLPRLGDDTMPGTFDDLSP